MNDTYGFVEKWLADRIGIESIAYPLESGNQVAAVDAEGFSRAADVISFLWKKHCDGDIGLMPINVNTVISGMKTIIHSFWADDNVLDEITGEEAKAVSQYHAVKAIGPSGARFNMETIVKMIEDYLNPPAQEQADGQAVPEEESGVIEDGAEKPEKKKVKKKKVKKISARQKNINNFIDHIVGMSPYAKTRWEHEGYHIISIGCEIPGILTDSFNHLACEIKKNIILLNDNAVATYVTKQMKDFHKLSQVEYHTMFLIHGAHCPDSQYYTHKSMLCLGFDVQSLHSIQNDGNINQEVRGIRDNTTISNEEKEHRINEIFKKKANSPLFRFDEVFKDTVTNVIWALKDRCVIYLMIDFTAENEPFYQTALSELSRRYNHSVSYDTLKEIDQAYLEQMHDDNKEDYIKFSIDNSKVILDQIKIKRDEHHKHYKEHLNKALEHAKIYQRYNDQIVYFNEEKFEQDERKKAQDNYTETLAIEKVNAIIVKDKAIYVYTKNLYAQDERTERWHDIGTFQISIGMHGNEYDEGNTVRIKNTKYQIKAFSGFMQAPHVYEDGHICHGNLAIGMIDAYQRRNMFELVYQVVLFLEDANTADSAGEKVNKWPEVPAEIAMQKEAVDEIEQYEKLHKMVEAEKKFNDSMADAIPIKI